MTGEGLQQYQAGAHAFDCRVCHSGQPGVLSKDSAHVGLIAYPSEFPNNVCAQCHGNVANRVANSLHTTMRGYHTLFEVRTGQTLNSTPVIHESFNAECNKCHATCGSCHISRPKSVGGGFINSHNFQRTPDMVYQCTACHGSRVGEEYMGQNEGVRADVHYVPHAKHCKFCHTGDRIHGDGVSYDHRYDVENPVACEDCHTIQPADNVYHATHGTNFQCQVCHAQSYKNCAECHAGSGLRRRSWMAFKIGRNPISNQRRGEYAVLRHIPVAEHTYEEWGVSTPHYSDLPTWKYATPHNIQRWTPRTDTTGGRSCMTACHSTPATTAGWFLRQVDLDSLPPAEREANRNVIVPDGPPPWP